MRPITPTSKHSPKASSFISIDKPQHNSSQRDLISTPVKRFPESPGDMHRPYQEKAVVGEAGGRDYTGNPKFKFCFLGLCMFVFLFALDAFIITSAVPQLINEFQQANKLAFLNSAFFIPCAALICFYSQIMTIVRPKLVYLAACVIFLVGCAVCGSANSMNILIVGRAIAGMGGAGLWSATYILGGEMIPLAKRPSLYGLFGLVFLVASIGGPLAGGGFTDMSEHGWRWCFYVSLPIGGAVLPILALTLPRGEEMLPFSGYREDRSILGHIVRLDWVGMLLCAAWVTCFGLALSWAGLTKSWSDKSVTALLVLFPLFFILFIAWLIWMGDRAMVPMPLLRSRHLWGGLGVSFFGFGVTVIALYYLQIYFQAIKGKSATKGAILLLALQLSMCPTIIIVSKLVERKGWMWPSIPIGGALCAIGCGLFYTFSPSTDVSKIIGYQILAGVGFGCVLNVMVVLVQADYVTRQREEPHATAVQNWAGFLGRIIGITIATSIFENKLKHDLESLADLPIVAAKLILSSPEAIKTVSPEEMQADVIDIYNNALNKVWIVCIAFAVACFLSSFLLKRLNMLEVKAKAEADIGLQRIESGVH